MKQALIGIHPRPTGFSDRWVEYCREHSIPFRSVNAFSSNIMEEVRDISAFLWHWEHDSVAAVLVARQILMALEHSGMRVFPNTSTCWHFDDKIAQKYLFEAIQVPSAPTWVFYNQEQAMDWIAQTDFPKVFKLRKGAGSSNVKLVKTRAEATRLCKVAFSRGFVPIPSYFGDLKTKIRKTKAQRNMLEKVKRAPAVISSLLSRHKQFSTEKGYIYFQEFMPGNDHDTRIAVIGDRAFGFVRRNRPGDFRASGSGVLDQDPALVDQRMVKIAFQLARKIGSQSIAMDFVYDSEQQPVLLEISYAYMAQAVYDCPGYWDAALDWHKGHVWPQDAIIEDILDAIRKGLT